MKGAMGDVCDFAIASKIVSQKRLFSMRLVLQCGKTVIEGILK